MQCSVDIEIDRYRYSIYVHMWYKLGQLMYGYSKTTMNGQSQDCGYLHG